MIKEAIGTGETVEEAKENALLDLNAAADDDIQIEVLATPKKKTLGIFGGSLAKVRVFVEVPDPKPQQTVKSTTQNNATNKPNRPLKQEVKKQETQRVNQQKVETSVAKEQNVGVPAEKVDPNSPAGKGAAYLSSIIDKLGCGNVALTVADIEGGSQITLSGEGLGVVIGHRGETLDALQYLVSLAANSGGSGYYRVVLNTGDYRQKREQTLESLARRMASQVLKTGKCRTLEPMNPYERRIIHTAVQAIEGVSSTSFGDGSGRRVVISPEGKTPRPRSDFGDRDFKGRNNNNFRGRNNRGPGSKPSGNRSNPPQSGDPSRQPKKDASDLPLYGKIN